MLIYDLNVIGAKVFEIRKRLGLTQAEVAEKADMSMRTYADFERGTVNMRLESILRVCDALDITPDALFTDNNLSFSMRRDEIIERWNHCSPREQETALHLLEVYFHSLA